MIKKNNVRIIYKNISASAIIQIINIIVPILTIPYLMQCLSQKSLGMILIGQGLWAVNQIIADLGLTVIGTYVVARGVTRRKNVSRFITATFVSKLVLAIALAPIYFIYLESVMVEHANYILWIMLSLFSQSIQVLWYFQGLQKFGTILKLTVISKISHLAAVIIFVNSDQTSHIFFVSLFFTSLIVTCYHINVITRELNFKSLRYRSWAKIMKLVLPSWNARIMVASYTVLCLPIVGLLGGATAASVYGVSEQIYKGVQSIYQPVFGALFPYMVKEKNWKTYFLISTLLCIIVAIIVILIIVSPFNMVQILLPQWDSNMEEIFFLFCIVLTFNYLSSVFGYSAYGAINRLDVVNRTILIGSLSFYLSLAISRSTDLQVAESVACSLVLAESMVFLARFFGFNSLRKLYDNY